MSKCKCAEDLSIEQLQRLLVEKRRAARSHRLERFRKSGRALLLTPKETPDISALRSEEETDEAPPPPSPRKFLDRALFVVEMVGVLGLIIVTLSALNALRLLNRESQHLLHQPAMTPTPLVMAVVLPAGHTPPTAAGGARPNPAEIPENLRPLVQSLASVPIPTPGPGQAIRIRIPAIGVDAPVVEGDGWEQLKKGVGHHPGSANPGQRGNLVLSGHDDVYGEVFRYLDRLKPGDKIFVYTANKAYTYIVTETHIVEPTDVQWLAPTSQPTITLISCYPYMVDNRRIVVRGVLAGKQ